MDAAPDSPPVIDACGIVLNLFTADGGMLTKTWIVDPQQAAALAASLGEPTVETAMTPEEVAAAENAFPEFSVPPLWGPGAPPE